MKSSKGFYFRVILTVFLVCFIGMRIYYRLTDDFRLGNISYEMPYMDEWAIPPLGEGELNHLNEIFGQKFTYIGKGAQSYAFASEDDKYVIKFFKFKHLKPSWLIDNLPGIPPFKNFKETEQYKKRRKLLSVFNGYRLAYGVHKEESGLIYVHLNKGSAGLKRSVVVKDKIGLERNIDLDSVNFVIQEKVRTSRSVIMGELEVGNVNKAKDYIRKLFDLYCSEYAKGIYDHDHGVLHNTGFAGEKPIHLDVGKLYPDENISKPEYALKDLQIVASKIALRIREKYPSYSADIEADIQAYFSKAFDKPFVFQKP